MAVRCGRHLEQLIAVCDWFNGILQQCATDRRRVTRTTNALIESITVQHDRIPIGSEQSDPSYRFKHP